MRPLNIAHVAPVATSVPPPKSGSVQTMTSLLTEGLVAKGQQVTLFATGDSRTSAKLHATYPHGYWHDETMWPWEMYEMLNIAAAVERAREFDIIHYEASYYPMSLAFTRLSPTRLDWRVTVDDPHTWTKAWTFAMPLTVSDEEPVYEYACHEGNYGMFNLLSGARASEKAAADAAKKGSN